VKSTCPNRSCQDYGKKYAGNIIKNGHDRKNQQRYLCQTCGRTFFKDELVRKPHQRKRGQKGLKSTKGRGDYYDEPKKKQTFSLTPTAIEGLDKLAAPLDISRSELVERIGRGIISLTIEEDKSGAFPDNAG
jgi:hypothetical protein